MIPAHLNRALALLKLLTLIVVLSGCAIVADVLTPGASVPPNEGPRFDVVLDDVAGGSRSTTRRLTASIRTTLASSEDLRGWLLLTDHVRDPDTTMFLNATIANVDRQSSRVGTPKHGYSTVRSVTVEVIFELVDARTGTVVAGGHGRGRTSATDRQPNDGAALDRAVSNGLARLIRTYAGDN